MAERLDIKKIFIAIILSLVVIQVGSVIYSQYYDSTPLKLGWAFMLILFVTGIITLFITSTKIGDLKKQDIFFIIIVFTALIAIFYTLPKTLPQIFSVIGEQGDNIKGIISSIVEAG